MLIFCTLFEDFVRLSMAYLVDSGSARVTFGLEPHVPLSGWITAKQTQTRFAKRLGGMFCQSFDRSDPAQAQRLAWAFLAALSGAHQRAIDTADYAQNRLHRFKNSVRSCVPEMCF